MTSSFRAQRGTLPFAAEIVIFLVVAYIVASILEWIIHKYIMHAKTGILHELAGRDHIRHHLQVNSDMSLNTPHDNAEGIYFKYTATIVSFLVFFAIMTVLSKYVLHFSLPIWLIAVLTFAIVCFHHFMWNSIHSSMHNHDAPYNDGIPRSNSFLKGTKYYDYLDWYHTIHHLEKGPMKGNYNVCFPFADYLFGTYRTKVYQPKRET